MEEIWRPVVGYEGFYEISNLGNLVRVSTYGSNPKACRKPRAAAHKKGYRSFHMCSNGVRKYRLAHIMVWEAFKGPVPDGIDVNHENGDRDDPSLGNLNLLTRSGNCAHSFQVLGRMNFNKPAPPGEDHPLAKLTNEDVIRIRELRKDGRTTVELAAEFGVSNVTIGHIARRKTWRHI